MISVPNAQIREIYGVTKGVDERVDESVLHWFGHIKRISYDSIVKKIYVGEVS